jgi:hypothetical protein
LYLGGPESRRGFLTPDNLGAALRRQLTIGSSAVLIAALMAASAGAITAPPQTQTDPSGDAGTAPDIILVSVTNDDRGQYRFTITFATPYGSASSSEIFLNTDRNGSTGDPQGSGADFLLIDDRSSQSSELDAWGPSGWQRAPSSTLGVQVGSDQKSITFSIGKSDLKDAGSFDYFVESYDGAGDVGHYDDAPSGSGAFTYVSQAVFTLSSAGAEASVAKAGGAWTLAMLAVRSDNNKTIGPEGNVTCSARAGSTTLQTRFKGFVTVGTSHDSAALCRFSVPKRLKGATLIGSLTVSDGGQSVSHVFHGKVR